MALGVLVLGLAAWFSPAQAQPAPSAALGIRDVLALSLSHPSVVARRGELDAAQSSLENARWQRYPSLSAQATSNTAAYGNPIARAQVPVWTGGRITADIDANEQRVIAAQAAVDEARRLIMDRAATSFADYSRLSVRVAAAELNLAEHQRLNELISRRVASEIGAISDSTLSKSRLIQAQAELAGLRNQRDNVRAVLASMLAQPVDQLATALPAMTNFERKDVFMQAYRREAPELRRLSAERVSAEFDISAQKAGLLPQLLARYDHPLNGGNSANGLQDRKIALVLDYQLGAGLSALSAVDRARARLAAANAGLDAAERAVLETSQSLWSEFLLQQSQARELQRVVAANEDVSASFSRQYAIGRKGWIDVLNAQRELTQARYAAADAEWAGRLAQLRMAISTFDPALTPPLAEPAASPAK